MTATAGRPREKGRVRRLAPELVDPAGAAVGEGPAWDGRRGELVWVDIISGLVRRSDAEGRPIETIDVGVHVGAALPSQGNGWLLATVDGFGWLGSDGDLLPVLDVEADRPELRFNDAKCDPQGRALAGSMRYDEAAGDGTLYRLDTGPEAVPLLTGQGISNGLGWSPDGRTLYYNDSLSHVVATFAYDQDTGRLGRQGELAAIDPGLGNPDGLCVDDDGCVWVALYGGGAIHRYRPDGTLDTVVTLPVPAVTSVAFGGERTDHLFITTAGGRGMTVESDQASEPTAPRPDEGAGGLWMLDAGISGPPATPWRPVAGVARHDTATRDDMTTRRQSTDGRQTTAGRQTSAGRTPRSSRA